jgi:hypothetical protein
MKIKASKIAFFYLRLFFRIETFQGVTADSNKKIPARAAHTLPGPSRPNFSILFSPEWAPTRAPGDIADRKRIAQVQILAKEMSTLVAPGVCRSPT